MKNKLSHEEYLIQCDEDILSILILHSLEYAELLKLDTATFPIDFEVWSETKSAESHISYKNYTHKIPEAIALEIGVYLNNLLKFPSEKWTHAEFESNPFWTASRIQAREFVKKLHLEGRGYWE
jgi:hypothetical protein